MADLYEDQQAVLDQLLRLVEGVDAVVLAGDIYNRAQPAPDVIVQFSDFLTRPAEMGKPVLAVRGNHDGEAQIAYAARLLEKSGVYVSDLFSGAPQRVRLEDEYGPVDFDLLPFIKPAQARRRFPEREIASYADAVRAALEAAPAADARARRVLVTHQFVSGAQRSDSEEMNVGGVDMIPAEVFAGYDYVALGHLHRAQSLAGGRLRYAGAPLCYSFDECGQERSATIAELGPKGEPVRLYSAPIRPLRPLARVSGALEQLAAMPPTNAYVQVILEDELRSLNARAALEIPFPHLLSLQAKLPGGGEGFREIELQEAQRMSPLEHFREFFTAQNGREPSEQQTAIVRGIIGEEGQD